MFKICSWFIENDNLMEIIGLSKDKLLVSSLFGLFFLNNEADLEFDIFHVVQPLPINLKMSK